MGENKKENVKEIAIEAKNVCIQYQIMKNVTVRHNLFHKHTKEEAFEAVKKCVLYCGKRWDSWDYWQKWQR